MPTWSGVTNISIWPGSTISMATGWRNSSSVATTGTTIGRTVWNGTTGCVIGGYDDAGRWLGGSAAWLPVRIQEQRYAPPSSRAGKGSCPSSPAKRRLRSIGGWRLHLASSGRGQQHIIDQSELLNILHIARQRGETEPVEPASLIRSIDDKGYGTRALYPSPLRRRLGWRQSRKHPLRCRGVDTSAFSRTSALARPGFPRFEQRGAHRRPPKPIDSAEYPAPSPAA